MRSPNFVLPALSVRPRQLLSATMHPAPGAQEGLAPPAPELMVPLVDEPLPPAPAVVGETHFPSSQMRSPLHSTSETQPSWLEQPRFAAVIRVSTEIARKSILFAP